MRSLVRVFVVYKCNKILLYSVRSDLIRLLFMLDSKPMLDHSQPAYSVGSFFFFFVEGGGGVKILNIFWGMKILWIFFFGHHKIGGPNEFIDLYTSHYDVTFFQGN